MKKLTELNFEELTVEQKLGMVTVGTLLEVRESEVDKYGTFEENIAFVVELIKKHSLGAVWIPFSLLDKYPDLMPRIHEAADYPILIFTDAEMGITQYKIGAHNAIGIANSEQLAYTFGKVTAATARKLGYNVVCDPVLDITDFSSACGGPNRCIGSDKYRVTELAKAVARGMHDGGVLTVAKHYPGIQKAFDSHMTPFICNESLEKLIDCNFYPYVELARDGLLDGVMKQHADVPSIDPDFAASISMKASNLLRDLGFDGFFISDALDMMGLRARYGDTAMKGLAIAGGNELALPWFSARKAYWDMVECYKNGMFTDERLDDAVRLVLAAQHKANVMNETELEDVTQEDIDNFNKINFSSVYSASDDGVSNSISREGKHYFAVMVSNQAAVTDDGRLVNENFTERSYAAGKTVKKIKELFPNSECRVIYEHPTARQNADVLSYSLGCEEVVFVTYGDAPPSSGSDRFTPRFLALMEAMQVTGRLTTMLYFGNPFVMEDAPHIKRRLIGAFSQGSVDVALEILAGLSEPMGAPTYDVKLK